MKVLLVNGSPNKKGSTNRVLEEMIKVFNQNEIDTEIFWLGNEPICGCIGCGVCNKSGKCFIDDKANEFLNKAKNVDGFVFATPVHFSSMSGFMKPFLDRVFFGKKNSVFRLKVAATICCARRGGSSSALDDLNKYPLFANMILVGSNYWNMVYGKNKDDIEKDLEGLQTARVLASNMVYVLKTIDCGKKNNIEIDSLENKIYTNFIF